jgi:N-acetylmuramoyl-L-alanine amidase
MKKGKELQAPENEGENKHRYKLNKKKFAKVIALLCLLAAGGVIAVHFIGMAKIEKAIAAIVPPASEVRVDPEIIKNATLDGKVIVVDAGHGGDDTGANGVSGSVESELNLKVATLLKEQLENKGANVVMTRSTDKLADTKEEDWNKRDGIISGSGADILVSIHMNSFSDTNVSGPLVLFLPGSGQGKTLADSIQQIMNEYLKPESPGSDRSDNLRILKYGNQPSVLVECGYISNTEEENKLISSDYQNKVANAIRDGVLAYFNG